MQHVTAPYKLSYYYYYYYSSSYINISVCKCICYPLVHMLYRPLSVSVFAAVIRLLVTAARLRVVRRRWNLGRCKCAAAEADDWRRDEVDRHAARRTTGEDADASVSLITDCGTVSVTGLSPSWASAVSVVDSAGDDVRRSGDIVESL